MSGAGGIASRLVVALERVGDRQRDDRRRARGARAPHARNDARSASPASSWIVCIGTRISAKRRPSAKSRASARTVSTGRPARGTASACSSSSSTSSAATSCPRRARSSATRPVPAPTSRIGPRAVGREVAPQRQVAVVGAALEVVPDDRVPHANDPRAAPRSTSSSRSSSIAVYVGSARAARRPGRRAARVERARRARRAPRSAPPATPAYLSRSAISGGARAAARHAPHVPARAARSRRPRSS